MNVPDKIFQSHSWLDINIYMFVKRNTNDGVIKVSLQQIANEFGVTRGKVNYILQKLYNESLLTNSHQTASKQFANSTSSENQIVKIAQQTASKQLANKSQTLEERKHTFGTKLIPYMDKYKSEMIRAFFNYWTEINEGGSKMRFEKEKTFEIAKRLARWHSNNLGKEKSSSLPVGMNLQNSKDKDYEKGLERWNK